MTIPDKTNAMCSFYSANNDPDAWDRPNDFDVTRDHLPNPHTGEIGNQVDRQIVDLAIDAERLGARSVHLGEHHVCDCIVSSPVAVLATISARTTTLRLSTAVTLLAHQDPVTDRPDARQYWVPF